MAMRKDVLVYISGPMTANGQRTIEEHTAAGVKAFLTIMQHGVPAFCPHLCGGYPSVWTALTHEEWVQYDLAIIDRCTHMVMIGDWRESKGAMREYDYAIGKGLPVAHSLRVLWTMLGVAHG